MTITYKEFLQMDYCWMRNFIYEGLTWRIDDINNKNDRLCVAKEIRNGRMIEVARKMNYDDIITII